MALPQQSRGIHDTAVTALRDTRHCSNSVEGYATLQQQQRGERRASTERENLCYNNSREVYTRYNNSREAYTALQQQQRGIHYATIATERDTRHCCNSVARYNYSRKVCMMAQPQQ